MESTIKIWRNVMFIAIAFAIVQAVALCFADGPFDTQVTVSQANAIVAKSAKIEQLSDRVALFLEGEEPERKLGLRIAVKSTAKFVAVRAVVVGQGRPVVVSRLAGGDYLLFGQPAIYAITVIESDPEKGLNFTDVESEIVGEKPTEPDKPSEPDKPEPPSNSDLAKLESVSREASKKLNDPKTSQALAAAYRKAALEIESASTVEAAKLIAQMARRQVLLSRSGASLAADWNSWMKAIEPEIMKHLGSVKSYQGAVLAVATSLEQ
jgi:hypothetical protein